VAVSRRVVARGFTLVELTVGLALGLLVVAMLVAATAAGTRLLARAAVRAEGEDTAQLGIEAFVFDVRRAGYDPANAGVAALLLATDTRLTIAADLDRDGAVDPASEEQTTWVCDRVTRKLSRMVGAQSLPLADGVTACALSYLDGAGTTLPAAGAGLDAAARDRVRRVVLDLTLLPSGARAPTTRRVSVALRGRA
jgi:Tfp pilus assembly protein PilW